MIRIPKRIPVTDYPLPPPRQFCMKCIHKRGAPIA
jgi:hypothetical protein